MIPEMTKRGAILFAIALFSVGCGDSSTEPPSLQWSDFAGEWRIEADQSSPSYGNCTNVNASEGGIRMHLNGSASFAAVTGSHNGGWGGDTFGGAVTGSLMPPGSGALRLDRPDGSGTLTLTAVTPTRMEGSFFALDNGFADPGSGRTPCGFDAVLVRP